MTPFLDITDFAARFMRPLTAAETLVATDLLAVASDWIYGRLPTIAQTDPAARTVVFEVVRDAIIYGPFARLESFQDSTAHRTEAGTLSRDVVEEFITDRHCRILGISLKAMPVANFRAAVSCTWGADYWDQ